jgi:hypothetical protein
MATLLAICASLWSSIRDLSLSVGPEIAEKALGEIVDLDASSDETRAVTVVSVAVLSASLRTAD